LIEDWKGILSGFYQPSIRVASAFYQPCMNFPTAFPYSITSFSLISSLPNSHLFPMI